MGLYFVQSKNIRIFASALIAKKMKEGSQTRRMHGHDYAIPGTYEVTMVVAGRRPVFGEIVGSVKAGGELVTPGVSECEKRIKNMALQRGLRLIHLQAEPMGQYWKPELSRFEACAGGSLLILAPWAEDMLAFGSDYERFHYLNRLVETVCAVGHDTQTVVQGLRPAHGGG
jgi:hypothetical protein